MDGGGNRRWSSSYSNPDAVPGVDREKRRLYRFRLVRGVCTAFGNSAI